MAGERAPGTKAWLHRLAVRVGPLLGLGLFVAALVVLRRQLHHYTYHDIVGALRGVSVLHLALALALTALSYLILTGYDALAVRYVGRRVRYRRIALASFLGYAFSNNVGFSALSGGPVRYRVYASSRFSPLDVAKIMAFCGVTLWLGFFAVAAGVFLAFPFALPPALHLPFGSTQPLGLICVVPVAVYFLFTARRSGTLSLRGWVVPLPSLRMAAAQLALSSFDWIAAGSVLFVLLPPGTRLSLAGLLGVFLLAQIAGVLSQVPGGLGVFETVMVVLMPAEVPRAALLASLVAYRGIYYLLPLVTAALTMGAREALERRQGVRRVARAFGSGVPWLVPNLLAFTTFVGGAVLLLSGATPAERGRLAWLHDFLPLPVVEVSHFLGSLAGVALLILARGLQRRLDAAYHLAAAVLGAGIALSLLKGADYEEAAILAVMVMALLPSRRHFYRHASLLSEGFSLSWLVSIGAVIFASLWLGFFAYKHVEYSSELWWRFALLGDAPRFLRASVGVVVLLLGVGLARLLRPSPALAGRSSGEDLAKAAAIVAASREALANLALLGDKSFLFSASGRSFIMYAVSGRSWVAMGDPVGADEERAELIWAFRELSDRGGGWSVFYEVGSANLPTYLDVGLSLLKLGEEARVELAGFSLEGGARKGLRYQVRRLEKDGASFEVVPAAAVSALLGDLAEISDRWLAGKQAREKRFSLGSFDVDYVRRFPVALVRDRGRIVAFANLWLSAAKHELSVDLMRHLPDAPAGVMDFLFVNLLLWGKAEGFEWFSLGMAPFAGLADRQLAPLWSRLGALLFRHGEHFYNFQGVRAYKDKFDPDWQPRYLVSPGGLALPVVLSNVAALVSGSVVGALRK